MTCARMPFSSARTGARPLRLKACASWFRFEPTLPRCPKSRASSLRSTGGRRTARGPGLPRARVRRYAPTLSPASVAAASINARSFAVHRTEIKLVFASSTRRRPRQGAACLLRGFGASLITAPLPGAGGLTGKGCPARRGCNGGLAPLPSVMWNGCRRHFRVTSHGLHTVLTCQFYVITYHIFGFVTAKTAIQTNSEQKIISAPVPFSATRKSR